MDREKRMAKFFGVRSIPAAVFFSEGRVVDAVPRSAMDSEIRQRLGGGPEP